MILCANGDDRIYLPMKAMRAAEHFLLCRYYDYQQVTYHKTVAGNANLPIGAYSPYLHPRWNSHDLLDSSYPRTIIPTRPSSMNVCVRNSSTRLGIRGASKRSNS